VSSIQSSGAAIKAHSNTSLQLTQLKICSWGSCPGANSATGSAGAQEVSNKSGSNKSALSRNLPPHDQVGTECLQDEEVSDI
jgi:hypothetical protein